MTTTAGEAVLKVDLTDPELFAQSRFWPVMAWLRANEPVYHHSEPDGPGFWVLSGYHDIAEVYSRHETFSSQHGMRLGSNPDAIAAVTQRMLIVSDPPAHTQLKRVLSKAFGPAETREIADRVRRVVAETLDDAVAQGEVDFVEVAKLTPNYVVCAMMGVPRVDWEWLGATTTSAFESGDVVERSGAHAEIFMYFADLLQTRRESPGNDLVSRMALDSKVTGGEPSKLTDEEIVFNCNGILAGANETTRYSAAGGVLALIENPLEWTRLRGADDQGVTSAVEEILRWTTPGMHALRTATEPTLIRSAEIAAGDRVTLWNMSANRDESVFDRADEFDIGRSPNRHVTFGHGHHMCLGARLARLELSCFFTELVARVESIELLGQPLYTSSNFTWGVRSLPVRLVPRRVR